MLHCQICQAWLPLEAVPITFVRNTHTELKTVNNVILPSALWPLVQHAVDISPGISATGKIKLAIVFPPPQMPRSGALERKLQVDPFLQFSWLHQPFA